MENKLFRNSVSALVIAVMVMSVFSVVALFDQDEVAASTESEPNVKATASVSVNSEVDLKEGNTISPLADAIPANNKVIIPTIKAGVYAYIWGDGSNLVAVWNKISNRDISCIGEKYYEPSLMTISHKKFGTQYATIPHDNKQLYQQMGARVKLNAGKYTLKTDFKKYYVDLDYTTNPDDPISFLIDNTAAVDSKTNTFYVKAKVKLSYDKKKGKLAKSKRTQWKNPTQKYGKLPKPKAKKGKKFIGWYTKKSGGKKIKSTTKVPTKNTITLYARYKNK